MKEHAVKIWQKLKKRLYNLILMVFIIEEESVKDVILGTTVYLLTKKTNIEMATYIKLKESNYLKTHDYHFFVTGMILGKIFFSDKECEFIQMQDVSEEIICSCFNEQLKSSLNSYLQRIFNNRQELKAMIGC